MGALQYTQALEKRYEILDFIRDKLEGLDPKGDLRDQEFDVIKETGTLLIHEGFPILTLTDTQEIHAITSWPKNPRKEWYVFLSVLYQISTMLQKKNPELYSPTLLGVAAKDLASFVAIHDGPRLRKEAEGKTGEEQKQLLLLATKHYVEATQAASAFDLERNVIECTHGYVQTLVDLGEIEQAITYAQHGKEYAERVLARNEFAFDSERDEWQDYLDIFNDFLHDSKDAEEPPVFYRHKGQRAPYGEDDDEPEEDLDEQIRKLGEYGHLHRDG